MARRKAYVLIDTATGEVEAVAVSLMDKPGIKEVDVTLGPHDIIAVIEGADAEEVAKTVLIGIAGVAGVIRTTTCLVVTGAMSGG